jgi:heparosan-N-sulfate-glucuronate 5-epimerase
MLEKFYTDLKSLKERYKIPSDLTSPELREYYFIFEEARLSVGKDQALIKKFDKNGIPINKTYIDVTDKDYVYFPISIGQMGLAIFHTYLKTESEEDKKRFLNFADWFFNNAEVTPQLGAYWMTDVSLPQYKNPGSWQSAFSQSRGISILLRGYQLTDNKDFAEMAEKALIPFTIPVSEGGVTSFTKWGPYYEEYTSTEPTMVLNGNIFALCGLHEFTRVFPQNNLAKKLFEEGLETLEKVLPEYDMGYWSRYNLCEADWHPKIDPATIAYQRLHINQLKMMYQLTGREIFNDYAQIFTKQDTVFNALKMYTVKYKALKMIGRL